MNWTIGEDRLPPCPFLGEFLQVVTSANKDCFVNQKILSTNWPQNEKRLTTRVNRNCLCELKLIGRGERIRTSDLTVPNEEGFENLTN